jgi:hypothetical protein
MRAICIKIESLGRFLDLWVLWLVFTGQNTVQLRECH